MACAGLLTVVSCEQVDPNYPDRAADPEFFHQSMKKLTDVIVHDIFSPPVASRIYAYPNIAAYEVLIHDHPDYQSLAGQLHGLEPAPAPEEGQEYCYSLAAVHAFLEVGRNLIFSEDSILQFHRALQEEYAELGMPGDVYDRSLAYGELVAQHILTWSGGDMYKETRTYPKYSITDEIDEWQPTPPMYMDGIEPSWNKIRTLVLDSADQFPPPPPTPFSLDTSSLFYREVLEVYHALDAEDQSERIAIAEFWDCNPYVSHTTGHVMFATKKITPGGHWMGIAAIASRQADANLMRSVEAYTLTSIALMDAFISCWDEKYRSRLLRPETFINRYLDENWLPALQTPPFPEYTSGHSVISRAAAMALTNVFGDNFAFEDDTEVEYGLPVRNFDSFLEASDEAAVSRLYGGIHYRPACDNGVAQGEKVGQFILDNISLRK